MKIIPVALLIALIITSSVPMINGASGGIHIDAYTNKNFYLSSEILTVTYSIYGDNGRPVSGSGWWDLKFWNYTSVNYTVVAKGTFTKAEGIINVNLALYNLSNAGVGRNYYVDIAYSTSYGESMNTLTIRIMDVKYYYFQIYTSPISGTYSPGRYARFMITSPIPSLPIKYIKIFYEGGTISYVKNAYLNWNGEYSSNFAIPSNSYPGEKIYISASIEEKNNTVNFTVEKDFGLYISSSENLNKEFLSGDAVNLTVESRISIDSPYYRFIVKDENDRLVTMTSGNNKNFTYKIPEDYTGILKIQCSVFNKTQEIGTLKVSISVVYAHIDLYADRNNYTGGEIIKIYTDFRSNVMKAPQFVYNIFADFGYGYTLIKTLTTENRSIEINTPSNPPISYRIVAYAIEGEMIAYSSLTIGYEPLVTMNAYIITKSNYAYNVYIPGQTIEIKYVLSKDVNDAILKYGFDDEFYSNPHIEYLEHAKSGFIALNIPENARTGIHAIHISISYDGGEINKVVYIQIDENPPWSLYLIWGMPLIDFIILLIVVTATVFATIYLRYGKKGIKEMEE